MPKLTLTTKFKKNRGKALSPSSLKEFCFFGIPIIDQEGNLIPDETLDTFIESAVNEVEAELDIKIAEQVIVETKSFSLDNYTQWSAVRCSYPVFAVESMNGFVGTTRQVIFPPDWFSIQKSSDGIRHRNVRIVPSSQNNGNINQSVVYAGIYPQMGYYGNRNIPDYWHLTYLTGWKFIPEDILKVIAYKAAMPIFDMLGDIIIGAGIANQSMSFDGFSQSVGTTSSAENSGYSARIKSYEAQIKSILPALKKKYSGIIFTSA